jgi:hypothetical protein
VNAYQSEYGGEEDDMNGVDGFVTKINSTGDIVFSSYFGGPLWDTLHFVDTDEQNNIFTCGDAPTNDFPYFTNAIQDDISGACDLVFLALRPNGSPFFGTFFGGSQIDHVWNMEYVASKIYIVGHTSSEDFPIYGEVFQETLNGDKDGFFLRFDFSQYLTDNPVETSLISSTHSTSSTSLEFGLLFVSLVFFTLRRKEN